MTTKNIRLYYKNREKKTEKRKSESVLRSPTLSLFCIHLFSCLRVLVFGGTKPHRLVYDKHTSKCHFLIKY
ncbi:MAG: hypothetical protein ACI4TX_01975 [Christensenellales bacterium]